MCLMHSTHWTHEARSRENEGMLKTLRAIFRDLGTVGSTVPYHRDVIR